jgi:hypothetical protein
VADGADLAGAQAVSHVERNREYWTRQAVRYADAAERAWAKREPDWGVWAVPESELRVLPDVAGKDVVELGCGTAYFSAWLARLGARPGGELVFLVNGTLLILCSPDGDDDPVGTELVRPYFGMRRFSWEGSVEFHLGYGDWIRLLRANGFEVEDLVEIQAPEGTPPNRFGFVTPEWSHKWPSEEVWKARK